MSVPLNYLLNVVANAASRVLGMGAGFFCFVLFARVLGSGQLGELAFVMAFATIAGNVADFGTNSALAKILAEHRQREPSLWFGNYLLVRAGLALVTVVLGVLASLFYSGSLRVALLLGCLATPFMAARFFESLFQIFDRPRFSVYVALVSGTCQIALCSGFLMAGSGLIGYMVAFALSQLIYFSVALGFSLRLVRPRFEWRPELSTELFRLALPMGVSALVIALYSRADVFMLTWWRTSNDVGLYNAAYRLLDLGVAIAVTAGLPLVPILTRRLKESREETRLVCTEIMGLVAAVLLPAAIVMSALAKEILTLVYGPDFAGAAPVLSVFSWMFMCTAYSLIGASINLAAGNMGYNYWLSPLAGLTSVGLNLMLIPRYGILGAAMGCAAGIVLTLCVVMRGVNQSIGNIHRPQQLIGLAVSGGGLHFALQGLRTTYPGIPVVLMVACSGVLYLGLAWSTGLIPIDRVREILASRRTSPAPPE